MDMEKPGKEHAWLQKFVGEWTSESQASMAPDQPPATFKGTETVRSVGGMWIIAEGKSQMPGGSDGGCEGTMFLTLGYDAAKGHYVGSWIGSMMSNMWVYKGTLDEAANRLTLDTQGPNMADPTRTQNYRETIEFKSDDHRTFSSAMQGEDGTWTTFMTAHYRRKK
jgi:hypothetical protein